MKSISRVLLAAAALWASATCAKGDGITTPTEPAESGDQPAHADTTPPTWHSLRIHVPEHLRSIGSISEKSPHAEDGEEPPYVVPIPSFWVDAYEVSNARFSQFVHATGYTTTAEEEGFSLVPAIAAGKRVSGQTLVASPGANTRVGLPDPVAEAWLKVDGATWRLPEGPADSSVPVNTSVKAGAGDVTRSGVTPPTLAPPLSTPEGGLYGWWAHLPVVHVSAVDAAAYCAWEGGGLPTEEQWEAAARGHKQDRTYPWGDKQMPTGTHKANTWQGAFPSENTAADGYPLAAPVSAYGAQNTWGMFNAVGNVAEWTQTHWCNATAVALRAPADMLCTKALQGAIDAKTYALDFTIPGSVVVKGGSFLSTPPHDDRARVGSRRGMSEYTTTGDLGFRCVYEQEWGDHTGEELSEGQNNARFVPAMPTPVPAALRPHLNGEVDEFGRPTLQAEAAKLRARSASGSVAADGAVEWGNVAEEVDPSHIRDNGQWQSLKVLREDAPPVKRAKAEDKAAAMRAAAEAKDRMERQAKEYQMRTEERNNALAEAMTAAEKLGVDIDGDNTMWNEPFDLHAHGTFDVEYVHESVSDEELVEMTNKGEFGSPGTPPLGAQAGLGDFATAGAGAPNVAVDGSDDSGEYDGEAVVDPDQYGGEVPQ